jgi:RHS repeat-associated protein
LGSIVSITDNNGTVVFKAAYDAWGKQTATTGTFKFHRGYTGHEHLPEFSLINMNGRMYDPLLGRFLSPDPFVQRPDFSQSFNRYSYCLNNPLLYIDPSGEWFLIDDLIAIVVGGVVNVVVNAVQGNIHSWGQGFSYFGVGAVGTFAGLYGGPLAAGAVYGAGNSFVFR